MTSEYERLDTFFGAVKYFYSSTSMFQCARRSRHLIIFSDLFLLMLLRFLTLSVIFIPLSTYSVTKPKHINLGIGYYTVQIYDETYSYDSDRLNGVSLSATYMFSDKVALRGTVYSLEQGDFDNTNADGWEALAYYGRGMATPGGKWYVGGGYFSEQWNDAAGSNTFNGLQLGGGFGYNWEQLAFDMLLHLRDTSDYDNYFGAPGAEINTAGVLSIMLSARF